jgi:hypothetical protein
MAERQTLSFIKELVAVVAVAFAVFFFMDDRHAHNEDVDLSSIELHRRILMSESTRYAEVAKYYADKLKAGEPLTPAELARFELVEKQQQRIREMMSE